MRPNDYNNNYCNNKKISTGLFVQNWHDNVRQITIIKHLDTSDT